MKRIPYQQKLKDPRWQKKRLEVLAESGWQCSSCGDQESTLHVHHLVYVKGREPWEYENYELVVLCESCHQRTHQIDAELKTAIELVWGDANFGESSIMRIIGYIEAVKHHGPFDLRVLSYEHAEGIADCYRKSTKEIIDAVVDGSIPYTAISRWWEESNG